MKSKSFFFAFSFILVYSLITNLTLGKSINKPVAFSATLTQPDSPTIADSAALILDETEDAGMEYIDQMIFIGESTTSHLANRGVLTDGKETEQVWSKADNTRTLSSKTTSEIINYPPRVAGLTIADACSKIKPDYVVLSFGLNGCASFVAHKNMYLGNYGALIKAIRQASPDTRILLQTVYPITAPKEGATSPFSDIDVVNQSIALLNTWLPEIAEAYDNVRICDTATVLCDPSGRLKDCYNNDDGIHLTADAYRAILHELRTHSWN